LPRPVLLTGAETYEDNMLTEEIRILSSKREFEEEE